MTRITRVCAAAFALLLSVAAGVGRASVIANNSLTLNSFSIVPSSGALSFTPPKTTTTFGEALDSLGGFDQQFWLPMLACAVAIVGLELLYRYTLIGHAFRAIAEDNYAARALGLPERNLRIASFAIAGAIGALAGFAGGQLLLAFFANAPMLTFYGFVPVALGGMGNNRGAVVAGLILGLFQQAANFLVGGIFASVAVFAAFIFVLLAFPDGLAGASTQRRV